MNPTSKEDYELAACQRKVKELDQQLAMDLNREWAEQTAGMTWDEILDLVLQEPEDE